MTAVHIDKQLANRISRGDESAFNEFFSVYFNRLYRFCASRLGDNDQVIEEIVQQTLIRAMRKIHLYRGESALFTWLCRLCRNEISDHFKRHNKHQDQCTSIDEEKIRAVLEQISDYSGHPDLVYERHELIKTVGLVLDYLPGSYGEVLEWKYILGLSVDEIGVRLGITKVAAQSVLGRARQAFRDTVPQLIEAIRST